MLPRTAPRLRSPLPGARRHARRGWNAVRTAPRPLLILLVLTALLGAAWSFATAPLNGPDESAHFSYIQHLAETGHIPHADSGTASDSTEVQEALLQLGLHPMEFWPYAKANWTKADLQRFHQTIGKPGDRKNGDGPTSVARNPPLYYIVDTAVYRLSPSTDLLHRLTLTRLFNIPWALLTVLFTWLAAAVLFRATWLRTLSTGMVALHPQLGFMTGVVNPDILLTACYAAVIWLGLKVIKEGLSPARAAWLLGLAGAGAATQGRGLPLIPCAVIAVALAWLRFRPSLRQTFRIGAIGAIPLLAMVALTYAVTAGASTGGGAYGGEVTRGTSTFNLRQLASFIWQFYFKRFSFMSPRVGIDFGYRQLYIERFFGVFGSLEIQFSAQLYDAIQLAAALGLLLLFGSVIALWRDHIRRRWAELLFLVAVTGISILELHVAAYRNILNVPSDPLLVGRYLLPLVPVYGMAIAVAVRGLPARVGPVLAGVLLGSTTLFSLASLGITMVRYWG